MIPDPFLPKHQKIKEFAFFRFVYVVQHDIFIALIRVVACFSESQTYTCLSQTQAVCVGGGGMYQVAMWGA